MVGNVARSLGGDVPVRASEEGSKEHAGRRSECADTPTAMAACLAAGVPCSRGIGVPLRAAGSSPPRSESSFL